MRSLLFSLAATALFTAAYLADDTELEYPYDFSSFGGQIPLQVDFGGHGPPDAPTGPKSIYETLVDSPQFSNLTRILGYDKDIVKLLNDSSDAGLTFFALPDWAFPKRHGKPNHPHHAGLLGDDLSVPGAGMYDLPAVGALLEAVEESLDSDSDDKDKKRKFLKKLLHAILSYHILPGGYNEEELAQNTTFATSLSLSDGSLDGQPLRVRVGTFGITKRTSINLYSFVVGPETLATNGVIHAIARPLFPPPSIFQSAFLFPKAFATYTSALQRAGLTDSVDRHWVPGKDGEKGSLEGATTLTAFLPTNRAFDTLPPRLRFFLFSPFGEWILKKLIQYHTVPDLWIHNDYVYNATSKEEVLAVDSDNSWADDWTERDIEAIHSADLYDALGLQEYSGIRPPLHHHPRPCCGPISNVLGPQEGHNFGARPRRPPGPPPAMPLVHAIPDYHLPPLSPRDILNILPMPGCHGIGGSPRCERPPRPPRLPRPELIASRNLTVPTLLGANHTLNIFTAKFKLKISIPVPGPHPPRTKILDAIWVNGQRVKLADVVGRNGAFHVVGSLISPRHKGRHPHRQNRTHGVWMDPDLEISQDGWEDWEEWLPKWAAEN
ncbi:hypothetical protein HGRIS_013374 [Hohenbuehelia grisea]|uniref:FAS1 domain-containing protein n=1 Tax=Hohenbuehelia grisea TaxID=104357 RepID=A0ABR3IVF3_9AGAR